MKKTIVVAIVLLVVLIEGVFFLSSRKFQENSEKKYQAPQFQIHEDVVKADVELGRRIFTVRNGCVECHGENLAGAKVLEDGAMGVVYGANITSHNLKTWSDEQIATAVRYGIHPTGRSLRFMPSFDYQNLSKADLAALIAYMRSVPPNPQPSFENKFGPLAKILSGLGKMPVMFPAANMDLKKGFTEKPPEGPTLEFGRYLASSCTGCHGEEFRGGKIAGGDPAWPEAANIRLGGHGWSEDKFKSAIKTGISPISGKEIRAPMPVALLKQMNEMELKALWIFLSSLN